MRAQPDPALGLRLPSIRVVQQFPAAWINSASAPTGTTLLEYFEAHPERSMPDNAQLVVVDLVIDEGESAQPNINGAMMDLYMLSLFGIAGGKERTESEFRKLIERSEFFVEQVKRLPSGNGIIYAYPK